MNVKVTIKDVRTISTAVDDRENTPIAEITLELERLDEIGSRPTELKFTEMLSVLADMTSEELDTHLENIIKDYVGLAFRGQKLLDESTGEWKDASRLVNREYLIEV